LIFHATLPDALRYAARLHAADTLSMFSSVLVQMLFSLHTSFDIIFDAMPLIFFLRCYYAIRHYFLLSISDFLFVFPPFR